MLASSVKDELGRCYPPDGQVPQSGDGFERSASVVESDVRTTQQSAQDHHSPIGDTQLHRSDVESTVFRRRRRAAEEGRYQEHQRELHAAQD
jgi:hypothetical protein